MSKMYRSLATRAPTQSIAMLIGWALAVTASADEGTNEPSGTAPVLAVGVADEFITDVPPAKPDLQSAEVVALGSGCPAGTWTAEQKNDNGHPEISVHHKDFSLTVGADAAKMSLDCTLSVKLKYDEPVQLGLNASYQIFRSGPVVEVTGTHEWVGSEPEPWKAAFGSPVGVIAYPVPSSVRSPCRKEQELRTTLSVSPRAGSAGTVGVYDQWLDISEKRCGFDEVPEPLAAKVLKVSSSGSFCPDRFDNSDSAPGTLYAYWPFSGPTDDGQTARCTLLIDLEVPQGYQFRGNPFVWSTWVNDGSFKVSATYSYNSREVQRTEWIASNADDRSVHRVEVWSPSCETPSKPVQLKIDLTVAPSQSSDILKGLSINASAYFMNTAFSENSHSLLKLASEWRRCENR